VSCLQRPGALGGDCTDGQLVGLFRAGDELAFAALHTRHRAAVRRYVSRLLHDGADVDDVVQETFARAAREFSTDRHTFDELRPWLLRVARNRSIDIIRTGRPKVELRDDMVGGTDVADAVRLKEDLRETMSALRGLPADQRRALVLNAVHGEPYAHVAEKLHISPKAAKGLAFRARNGARRARRSA